MNNAYIDLEKITSCIETLSSIESIVNYNNLAANFDDMDNYFRKINFEHANCLYYRDYLDQIYDNLEFIKRRINELTEYLRKTKINYSETNENTNNDLLKISKELGTNLKKSLEGDITTIPKVEKPQEEPKPPINTLPIGVAIAATGIAGSIGAVILDEKYREKEIDEEETDEYETIEEPIKKKPKKEEKTNKQEIIEPYKAVRREREADKFYGNQFQDFILEDEEDTKEFDDDFYE